MRFLMPEVHKDGTLVKFYNSENKMGPHGVAVVLLWSWNFKMAHVKSNTVPCKKTNFLAIYEVNWGLFKLKQSILKLLLRS